MQGFGAPRAVSGPGRSYSDLVCVVICFSLNRLVRPGFCSCPEGRVGLSQGNSADAPKAPGSVRTNLPVRANTPDVPQPGRATEAANSPAALAVTAPQLMRVQDRRGTCADGMEASTAMIYKYATRDRGQAIVKALGTRRHCLPGGLGGDRF